MTNAIWIIIGFLFCAIAGYGIGLHRGFKVSDGLYDEGWIDCEEHMKQHYEMTEIEPMLDDLYEEQKREKQQKARRLVRELDELFQDSNENARSSPQEAPETTQNEKMNGNTTEK